MAAMPQPMSMAAPARRQRGSVLRVTTQSAKAEQAMAMSSDSPVSAGS